jgi:hypothetical protein
MLRYSEFAKTSPSVNNKVVIKKALNDWITPNFKVGDCLVTLTYKPSIKFDEARCSKDVNGLLNRLNRIIYGKSFDKGLKRLRCCPVFEYNQSQGVHVHMLLERPVDKSRFNGDFDKLVIDTWYRMDNAGIKKAQDVRDCYAIQSLMAYMSKQTRIGDNLLKYDVNNFYWK